MRDKIDYFSTDLVEKVIQTAKKDGVITDEERAIISQLEIDAREFEVEIKNILSSGAKMTQEELVKKIELFKIEMIKKAIVCAFSDGRISKDENELLKTMIDFISEK
ncbi:MAG: hypothetical protein ACTSYA_12755 [Candidatus Kariarchaeaceae archaeon]